MHHEEGTEPNHCNWKELNLWKVSQGESHFIGDGKGVRIE
jgi:hypothetical protein